MCRVRLVVCVLSNTCAYYVIRCCMMYLYDLRIHWKALPERLIDNAGGALSCDVKLSCQGSSFAVLFVYVKTITL